MKKAVVVKAGQSEGCPQPPPALPFIARDMLEEFLVDVTKKNENNLLKPSQHAGSFKKLRLIGEARRLPIEFRSGAVFMIQYIDKLYSSTCSDSNNDTENSDWILAQTTIQEHFVLRIMSCVQIASKISFYYQIVNNTMALKFLRSHGYLYKSEDLLDSELLVLKTLNFQVNVPSPFTHTELLIVIMGYNNPSVPVKHLHSISLKVLTYVYLRRNTIFESLLKNIIQNSTPTELQRAKFLSVKEDCMLLAVGVIGTSAFMLNHSPWCKVVQQLASISGVSEESILEFSQIILQHIFTNHLEYVRS
ncbi:cyclin N-terminal domain-containing protein 1 [Mobula birostris]|uniref:cyclin N-terminal domain-containing protein 1 n=1 Tax=Mobula birostris TaxID=1983395 RepID=UPI003B2811FE